jgi:hypothetical protein
MTQEHYEQQAAKIASEGLAYYLQQYGAKSEDPELQKLYDEGKAALDKIEAYLLSKGVDMNDF